MSCTVNAQFLSRRSGIPKPFERTIRNLLRKINVHENVKFGCGLRVGRGCVVSSPHSLQIGNHVAIGPRTIIQVDGVIGDFTLIGMGVQIVTRDDHLIDQVGLPVMLTKSASERSHIERDSVFIGQDVWIGGHATILSGITIGDCSIIGAGSVVTKDIPPFSIAVGNPAKVVGLRFEKTIDQELHLEIIRKIPCSGKTS